MGERHGAVEDMVTAERDFWRAKRVLITGHTGFQGSWLALCLHSLGADVTGFALDPPTRPSLYEVARLAEVLSSMMGDVRDLAALTEAFERHRPDVVIHLAAQPLVRRAYRDPLETYSTNVMGTVNVLEAARITRYPRVLINVTSDKCYENHEWLWGYREDEAMGGKDPYSSSKACAELISAAYRRSFFGNAEGSTTALASVRAGNVIGGGDWAEDRLVPDLMRSFSKGHTAQIRNPAAVRPWQHVLDPLRGYLILAQRMWEETETFSEAWNFGPSDDGSRPVAWIATQLASLWGDGARWSASQCAGAPPEAGFLKLDSSKARARLQWMPQLDITAALEATVGWYKALIAGLDMRRFTQEQIETRME
ncbi:MAG: CDP-glucose 4,6-dehydratase [Gammaproteobacteria bacterium]